MEKTFSCVPDLHWVNRNLPIRDVAMALDLRFDVKGFIHCWHPDSHQHGDRTASVAIWPGHNQVKCFGNGCDIGPLGPVDLVTDVRKCSVSEAARWIAEKFSVPGLQRGAHLAKPLEPMREVGYETPLQLLVRSGIWARLSGPAQSLVPTLLESAQSWQNQTATITISYAGLRRYSGVRSDESICKAIKELECIGWLKRNPSRRELSSRVVRTTTTYTLTPLSNEVKNYGNGIYRQHQESIKAERELRDERRAARIAATPTEV